MPYTSILRTCLSCMRRVPTQFNRQILANQFHTTQWSRLMSSRHFGILSQRLYLTDSQELTQVRYNSNRQGFNRNRDGFYGNREDKLETIRSRLQELLSNGSIIVPEPIDVTALPPKVELNGNENFIACEITHTGPFPDIDVFMINATSRTGNFSRVCNPGSELYSAVTNITGMQYDVDTEQVMRDGEPVETVESSEAMQDFVNFVKEHDNPVLIYYSNKDMMSKVSLLTKKYGLYDEMMSAVPFCLNVAKVAKRQIPFEDFGGMKLELLCEKILGLELPVRDQLKRSEGICRLFTEYLQQKGFVNFVQSTEYDFAKRSLIPMFVDRQLHFYAMEKLARAGISLYHLNYLQEKGFDEFMSCLRERNISYSDIKNLFEILSEDEGEI